MDDGDLSPPEDFVEENSTVQLETDDNGYSSCSGGSKRRKRHWAGTDLLVNNPNFAGAIEAAIRNALENRRAIWRVLLTHPYAYINKEISKDFE
ncbi:Os11g0632000 [Oryza sativa Japonica Group]|nr:hypothetical protein OsJ_34529 [Oryza sativa Japonica Group]BAT14952.1 Os11g0632000 [Oryza sativa Japonica Group]